MRICGRRAEKRSVSTPSESPTRIKGSLSCWRALHQPFFDFLIAFFGWEKISKVLECKGVKVQIGLLAREKGYILLVHEISFIKSLSLKSEFVETTTCRHKYDRRLLNRSRVKFFFHLLGLKKMVPVDAVSKGDELVG